MSAELLAISQPMKATHGEIHSMPILILNVHENCNCKCTMCDIWKRAAGSEVSLNNVVRYQNSIRKLCVRQVVLTGGEPLLHSHFDQLCTLLKECNVKITLLTTGLLLQKRADSVMTHIDEVIVSLDGPEEIHDSIRRVSHAYRLLKEGVTAIKRGRPSILIHARSTVQRENFRFLRQTVDAAKQIGCDSISFLAADVTSHAFNRNLVWPLNRQDETALCLEEVSQLEREIDLLIETSPGDTDNRYVVESPEKLRRIARYFRERLGEYPPQSPRCNAPWVSAVVEVDGSIRPCFFHARVATAAILPLEDAINSAGAKFFRQTLDVQNDPVCQRCVCSLNYRS
jgi:MoaA/NifB/PqqE/SkfB family radical SAM enzyme